MFEIDHDTSLHILGQEVNGVAQRGGRLVNAAAITKMPWK
jgi:hypothetical protein